MQEVFQTLNRANRKRRSVVPSMASTLFPHSSFYLQAISGRSVRPVRSNSPLCDSAGTSDDTSGSKTTRHSMSKVTVGDCGQSTCKGQSAAKVIETKIKILFVTDYFRC